MLLRRLIYCKELLSHTLTAIHSWNKIDILKQIINQGIEFVNLDYSEPKAYHESLLIIQKTFLITTPSPNFPDIVSNLVKEIKKIGIMHIEKLSAINANAQSRYAMG